MSLLVDIEKFFGPFHLKVSFECDKDVLALLGASGSGKSVTLKCIAGIEKPDKGKIILDGKTLFDSDKKINLPPQKRRVGYLFQQYALFPNMTVEQNIACGVRNKDKKIIKSRVKEIIEMMDLIGSENKHPNQLSGGQQQRVALARILINEPDVLLLDEPFSALDAHLRFQLEREVQSVINKFHKPVILVSHDRDEAYRLCDTIAIMQSGNIECMGSKYEVFSNPKTTAGARLTGCKNISEIDKVNEETVHASDWDIDFHVENCEECVKYIGIRAHDIHLQGTENGIIGEVVDCMENPFSYSVFLRFGTGTKPVVMELDKETWKKCKTDTLMVYFDREKLLLLGEEYEKN